MKRYLLLVVSVIFVTLVGAIVFLVARVMWQRPSDVVKRLTLDLAPGVAQQIKDFRRVKMQDGRMVWEVAARGAQVYDGAERVEVIGITLHWYLKDGRVVGLQSERGVIHLDGKEIRLIELDGSVIVSLADYLVRVEAASYNHDTQRIVAPGQVDVSGKGLRLHGTGLEVDIHGQHLALLSAVTMNLTPSELPHKGEGIAF